MNQDRKMLRFGFYRATARIIPDSCEKASEKAIVVRRMLKVE
jgi:hypothetical protein